MQSHSGSLAATAPRTWPDRVGIWASVLCVLHCLLTPVLLSMSAVLAHFLPSEERTHRTLAVAIALIGALALIRGYRTHRRRSVPLLMAAGLALIGLAAFQGDRLAAHWQEVCITMLGSACMIASHRMNHTFCRDCSCVAADRCLG